MAAATVADALAILAAIVFARRASDIFTRRLAIGGALLAFVAVAWAAMAVILIPACR